jgi:hypothetical protein
MPSRLLKPGLCDSEKWNACSWPAQSLYVRLLTRVDDYGRFDANPALLRGHCFALRDDVDRLQIISACEELDEHGLVLFYKVNGKSYLQVTNWSERVRSASKFPAPPTVASNCPQMPAVASTLPTVASIPRPSPSTSTSTSTSTSSDKKRSRAVPPSLEEVKLQAAKIGLTDADAEKYLNYYESNGWRVGRNPMKSWTAALSNWKASQGTYDNHSARKPNPRNAGLATDPTTQGKQIADELARRNQKALPQ